MSRMGKSELPETSRTGGGFSLARQTLTPRRTAKNEIPDREQPPPHVPKFMTDLVWGTCCVSVCRITHFGVWP